MNQPINQNNNIAL